MGATLEEIAEVTGFTPQRVGQALSHLRGAGKIIDSGIRRASGLIGESTVWIKKGSGH